MTCWSPLAHQKSSSKKKNTGIKNRSSIARGLNCVKSHSFNPEKKQELKKIVVIKFTVTMYDQKDVKNGTQNKKYLSM